MGSTLFFLTPHSSVKSQTQSTKSQTNHNIQIQGSKPFGHQAFDRKERFFASVRMASDEVLKITGGEWLTTTSNEGLRMIRNEWLPIIEALSGVRMKVALCMPPV